MTTSIRRKGWEEKRLRGQNSKDHNAMIYSRKKYPKSIKNLSPRAGVIVNVAIRNLKKSLVYGLDSYSRAINSCIGSVYTWLCPL